MFIIHERLLLLAVIIVMCLFNIASCTADVENPNNVGKSVSHSQLQLTDCRDDVQSCVRNASSTGELEECRNKFEECVGLNCL